MMRKSYLFVLLSCLTITSTSFGALNAYLTLAGEMQGPIDGGVTLAGREGSIMVMGFSHEVHAPRDAASGLPTGKRQHEPLRITKEIDKSTPLLMEALTSQETLNQFELNFWQPSKSGQEYIHYTIRLTNANVVAIRQEMLNNKYPENMQHKEREHITFVYDSIEWIYHDEADITADDTWNYVGASVPISDLTGDGQVNLLDFAVMADEWLRFQR